MIDWLKFFFGGFFVNKFALQGKTRSLWNTLAAFVIGWALIYVGLVVGYSSSFATHYDNCTPLKSMVGDLFDGGLTVSTANYKARSSVDGGPDNAFIVNTFTNTADAEEYRRNGYDLIFDTRPVDTTYDDFTVSCVSSDGSKTLTYEEYKTTLSDSAKSNYSVKVKYSGKEIEFTDEKIAQYNEYLARTSDETDGAYNADIASEYDKLADGDTVGLYELYFKAYYPELVGKDAYGKAPTLRSWYVYDILNDHDGYYLAIFDDAVIGNFVTDGGVPVSFSGYYMKMDGFTASTSAQGNEFIIKAFDGSSGMNMNIYLINVLKITPIIVLIPILIALIVWLVGKALKSEAFLYLGQTIKVVCSFVLIAAVATFLSEIALSFCLARGTVFSLSLLIFGGVIAVRTIILAVMEFISWRNVKNSLPIGETTDGTESAEVFEQ